MSLILIEEKCRLLALLISMVTLKIVAWDWAFQSSCSPFYRFVKKQILSILSSLLLSFVFKFFFSLKKKANFFCFCGCVYSMLNNIIIILYQNYYFSSSIDVHVTRSPYLIYIYIYISVCVYLKYYFYF